MQTSAVRLFFALAIIVLLATAAVRIAFASVWRQGQDTVIVIAPSRETVTGSAAGFGPLDQDLLSPFASLAVTDETERSIDSWQ